METCLCAAILCNGKVYRGHRHHHAFQAMHDELSWDLSRKQIMELTHVQGFLTTRGRFVTREEGRTLQDAAGIPSADAGGYRGDKLYSEDLY
jgi:hypothetical protein